jgi:hypothetical protein
MTNYLSLLQSLIDEERDDPIEYTDIKGALSETTIHHDSYYVLYNSLMSCLHELWLSHYSLEDELKEEFKQFIVKNRFNLVIYSLNELDRLLSTLKRTIERFNAGEIFQEHPELLNQEIYGNLSTIRNIIEVSDFIFNQYQIDWLDMNEFIQHMGNIVSISNNVHWKELHHSFNELKQSIY